MVWKRMSFIAVLLVLFAVCFYWMNQSYDPLARYPYADDADREILLEYLDQEDINYLITQQIKPEEIMPFIAVEGFDIANTRWYSTALQAQEDDVAYIVNFINEYNTRSFLFRLAEQVTYTGCTYSNEHFHKVGTRKRKERYICFTGNSFCQQSLTGSRRAYQ